MTPTPRPRSSSIYPLLPSGSRVIHRTSENDLTTLDRLIVVSNSLFMVGSVIWIPAGLIWALMKMRKRQQQEQLSTTDNPQEQRKKRLHTALALSALALLVTARLQSHKVGEWLQVRKWRVWTSWLRFLAMEVIADNNSWDIEEFRKRQAMLVFIPHGIFPFGICAPALPELGQQVFGRFRAVVAAATRYYPFVGTLISWARAM